MIADEEVSNVIFQSRAFPVRALEDKGEHVPRPELVHSGPANTTDRVEQGHLARILPSITAVLEKSSISAPRFLEGELDAVVTIKQRSAGKRRQSSKGTINDLFSRLQ